VNGCKFEKTIKTCVAKPVRAKLKVVVTNGNGTVSMWICGYDHFIGRAEKNAVTVNALMPGERQTAVVDHLCHID
jgi:hypothetical protein